MKLPNTPGAALAFVRSGYVQKLQAEVERLKAATTDYCMEIDRVMKERDAERRRAERAEAALAKWLIKDEEGNYPEWVAYYTPTLHPIARAVLDAAKGAAT